MPPSAVRTVRDQIYWQYAKLISKSAGFGIDSRGFQMQKFMELRDGKIQWSSTVREWLKENEKPNQCIYCKEARDLTVEHILPRSCGGPDITDNTIRVCKRCNSSKGGKRLYEWIGYEKKDNVPRIAEGKYLKLLYELHSQKETLETDKENLKLVLCPQCNMQNLCKTIGKEGKMTVFCLEGTFNK
ncbi:MAG: HNH endonuclease [Candidatus Gracilibacteria bacterium]